MLCGDCKAGTGVLCWRGGDPQRGWCGGENACPAPARLRPAAHPPARPTAGSQTCAPPSPPPLQAYITVAPFVAAFPEYLEPLAWHLLRCKLRHWEAGLRGLAAQALAGERPAAARGPCAWRLVAQPCAGAFAT